MTTSININGFFKWAVLFICKKSGRFLYISYGLTANRIGNRNTLRDQKCRPDWPPDSIADFISDMTLIYMLLKAIIACAWLWKNQHWANNVSYFVLQIDEAVHHDQLVILEKLYNAFTKVDLAAGNQVIDSVYLFRKCENFSLNDRVLYTHHQLTWIRYARNSNWSMPSSLRVRCLE